MQININLDFDKIFSSKNVKKIKPNNVVKSLDIKLGLLILIQLIFIVTFHTLDKAYQTWDSAGHIGMSFLMADKISAQASLIDILKTSDYYPPFVQLTGAVLSLIFGYHSWVLLALTAVFFFLAIIYLYKVVLFLTKNANKAIITATIFSLFPQIAEQSRIFLLDLPLIALLLISFYYLLKSEGFYKKKYSVFFFVAFSLVQLTKWYGFVFLLAPVIYILFKNYSNKEVWKKRSRAVINNILVGSALILVIAIPWYVANYNKIIEYSAIFSQAEEDDPQKIMSLVNFTYYPRRIITHQIMLIPTILMSVGLLFFVKKKKKFKWPMISALFIPYFVFTFLINNKNLRYLLPLVPVYAYLIMYLLYEVKKSLGKQLFAFSLVGLLLYQVFAFSFLSFNQVKAHTPILTPLSMLLIGPFYNDYVNGPEFYSYEAQYWPVKEILDFVVKDANYPKGKGLGVTPLFDQKNFSLASFEMLRREERLNDVYVPVPYFQFDSFDSDKDILDYFDENSVRYVLVPSNPGPSGLRNYSVLSQLIEYFGSYRNTEFVLIKKFRLPDGNYIRVFKRKIPGEVIVRYEDDEVNGKDESVNEAVCKNDAGKGDGIETIKLTPFHTYVFYTGDFAVNGYVANYKEGTLYILKLENIPHTSNLDVYNLPQIGTSMCDFPYLNVDITENIKKPLTESGHCGTDCERVIVVTWQVGEANFDEKIYTRESFPNAIDSNNSFELNKNTEYKGILTTQ